MPISEDEYHLVTNRFIFLEGDKQKKGGGGDGDDDFGIQSLDKVFTRYHVLQGYEWGKLPAAVINAIGSIN